MSRPWTAVYEGIRTSGKLARLPDDTCRFFYTQLLLVVDAYGCIEADPVALDAKVWPALKKPGSETVRAMNELWRVGLVDIHGDARRYWLHLPDWDEKAGTHLKRKRGKPEFTTEPATKKDSPCPSMTGVGQSMTGVGPSMPVHDCPRPVYDGKKEKKDRPEETDERREDEEKDLGACAPASPKRSRKPTDPNHAPFVEWWCESFQIATGKPYAFQGGKDAKHVADALRFAGGDLEVAKDYAARLIRGGLPWFTTTPDLGALVQHWNKLTPNVNGKHRGRRIDDLHPL